MTICDFSARPLQCIADAHAFTVVGHGAHDPGAVVLAEIVLALERRFAVDEDHVVVDQELDALDKRSIGDLDLGGDPRLAEAATCKHQPVYFGVIN